MAIIPNKTIKFKSDILWRKFKKKKGQRNFFFWPYNWS